MDKNEIKKEFYKRKPIAHLSYIRKGVAVYKAILGNTIHFFEVPISDMGDADFFPEMDAKLLIRWLITENG